MRCLWLALCLLVLSLSPRVIRAEQGETPEYTQLVALGIAEFDDKNFVEARAHFARAHKLYPNARTLRALGMVAFELKKYKESVDILREALSERERPLDAEQRTKVEGLVTRAKGFLAHITIEVSPVSARQAELSLDGLPVAQRPDGLLVLEAGDHLLELKAPGYISDKRKLEIHGGERETLRVSLVPLAAGESVARNDSAPRRPLYKNPWLWTVVGVVVAGAAAGTAIALTRDSGPTQTDPVYLGNSGAPALKGPPL